MNQVSFLLIVETCASTVGVNIVNLSAGETAATPALLDSSFGPRSLRVGRADMVSIGCEPYAEHTPIALDAALMGDRGAL